MQRAYWIEVYQGGKQRRQRLGQVSLKFAQDMELKRKVEIREGKFVEKPTKITLPQLLDKYLQHLEVGGASSVKAVRSMFKTTKEFFGNVDASGIDTYAYKDHLLKKHSHKYVDNHLTSLRAAYNFHGKLLNPVNGKMFLRPDSRRFVLLSSEQLQRLLATIKTKAPHIWPLLVVALNTGLRQRNVFSLRRDQVDFENKLIRVVQKGAINFTVPMNHEVFEVLSALPDNLTPWFVINPKTRKPYETIKKRWASCLKAADIRPDFRWHDLRKQFATSIVLLSGNPKLAQTLLGHTNFSTTEIYLNLPSEEARRAVNALETALKANVG